MPPGNIIVLRYVHLAMRSNLVWVALLGAGCATTTVEPAEPDGPDGAWPPPSFAAARIAAGYIAESPVLEGTLAEGETRSFEIDVAGDPQCACAADDDEAGDQAPRCHAGCFELAALGDGIDDLRVTADFVSDDPSDLGIAESLQSGSSVHAGVCWSSACDPDPDRSPRRVRINVTARRGAGRIAVAAWREPAAP
jgi:hypothetical protein